MPDAATVEKCTLEPFKSEKSPGGKFATPTETCCDATWTRNADNKVDQWCYFKNGIEVYRDIDSNFNRKADQYRWLGTAGIRWAIDADEDGQPDSWKVISPEEVSEEVVLALSTRDAARFKRLLLTPEELRDLQLGDDQAKQLAKKIAETAAGFEELLRRQDFVDQRLHVGEFRWHATRSGACRHRWGRSAICVVYENAVAVIESGGTHNQVIIGTLVQAGDVWRLIDLPKSIGRRPGQHDPRRVLLPGVLGSPGRSRCAGHRRAQPGSPAAHQPDGADRQGPGRPPRHRRNLRPSTPAAPTCWRNWPKRPPRMRSGRPGFTNWPIPSAQRLSPGPIPKVSTGSTASATKLEEQKAALELVAYIKFRYLSAAYMQSMQQDDADFAKIQDKWLADLEQFVNDYAATPDAADAMLQLAMAEEFAGDDEGAVKWYGRIATEFPGTQVATKASGAKRRIESVGQILTLAGKDLQGNAVDVASYRGKVVLVHFWATWSVRGRPDISVLKDMQTKYGKDNVAIVGVNVDNDQAELNKYLAENNLPWPQLYAPGGLDSPLATAYGILVLPTMMLADRDGKVISRDLTAGEVDNELRKLLR